MDIWGGYMMDIYGGQPNPTMLLENISLFFWKLSNNFARKHGLSYSSLFFSFFQAGIRVPIVLDISDTCPFFQYSSFHFLWITFV
jgi:hypothetical protein